MGGKQSTTAGSPRVHAGRAGAAQGIGLGVLAHHHHHHRSGAGTSSRSDGRQRARSLSSVWNGHAGQPMAIPADHSVFGPNSGSPDSDNSTPDDLPFGRVFAANSLPVQLVSFNGIKCPVCSKFVFPDDVECHLVMCLTKPRIIYNEDVLTEDKGECVICLEELLQGDTIARLPCLCIYHKNCIDAWFEVNRSCPEHPLD